MSDTAIDTATEPAASSPPAAPPQGGDPQGSAPASVDTTAPGQDEPKGPDPERQARREARAFAAQRRENRELQRQLGRMDAELAALRQQGTPAADGEQPPRQERSPAHTAAAQAFAEHRDAIMERVEDAGDGIEGFEKVMDTIQADTFPGTRVMLDFLGDSDRPADVAKWLAENPGEARKISRMSDVMAVRALEKAEAKLSAKPAPKTTQAPPPVPTVGGRSTPSFDPDKASMEDYAAHWKAKHGIK